MTLQDADAVLVMDGDGEDPPEAIPALLAQAGDRKDFCIVAQRRKRTEKISFKLSYMVYKTVFRLVTGKQISFGNFSLTSISYAPPAGDGFGPLEQPCGCRFAFAPSR